MGEDTAFARWLDSYRAAERETVLERNALMTDLYEQAAADKVLFQSHGKAQGFELRTPEYVCPWWGGGQTTIGPNPVPSPFLFLFFSFFLLFGIAGGMEKLD